MKKMDLRAPSMEGYGYEDGNSPFPTTGLREGQEGQKQKKMFGIGMGRFGVKSGEFRAYMESVSGGMSYDLIVSKTFYFFFFAAFGSLFPLIAVYFKQLGMNPAQTGLLIGLRPFVEFLSAPFWGGLATKYKKGKLILLFSLFCWVAFTLALAFITTPAHYCLKFNGSDVVVVEPFKDRKKRSFGPEFALPYQEDSYLEEGPAANQQYFRNLDRNARGDPGLPPTPEVPAEGDELKNRSGSSTKEEGGSGTGINSKPKGGTTTKAPNTGAPMEDKSPTAMPKTTTGSSEGKNTPTKTTPRNTTISEKERLERLYKAKNMHLLPHPEVETYGLSPLPLNHKDIANLDHFNIRGLVSPPYSNVVYRSKDIYDIFLLLLLMMIVGEFVSAPSVMLADTATLGYLGDDTESYGKQRMYGSLGWGVAMFFLGIALDYSNVFTNHPCGTEQLVDRNYTVCFAVFSVLMCCAFIAATQMRFIYDGDLEKNNIALGEIKDKIMGKFQEGINKIRQQEEDVFQQVGGIRSNVPPQSPGNDDENRRKVHISLQENGQAAPMDAVGDACQTSDNVSRPSPYCPRGKPGQMGTMPDWLSVLKNFGNFQYGSVIFILWYMGFGVGLVFAFLFWHLQDLTGTPMLFGIASVIAHVAEIFAYIFSKKVVLKIGHIRVLYIGLAANIARFLYISWIRNPWWVLPFELIQGLTHAFIWAAICSYILQATPTKQRATAQIIIVGIHHSFGRGCGALIGGILVLRFGTENTFRGYAIACIFIVAAYALLDYFHIRRLSPVEGDHEPKDMVEENSHLAPHGVPMTVPKEKDEGGTDQVGGYGATSRPLEASGESSKDAGPPSNYGQGDSCFYQGYGDDNGSGQVSYNMWNDGKIMDTIQQKRRTSREDYRDNY